MKTIRIIKVGISEVLFFIFSYIAGIAFLIIGGFIEPISLHLALIGGFIIIYLIRFLFRKSFLKRSVFIPKRVVFEILAYLLVLELFLLFVVPLSSIVPEKVLIRTNVVRPIDTTVCQVEKELESVKALWQDRLEYDKVKIVEGGLMSNLWWLEQRGWLDYGYARIAMTFGDTIYLHTTFPCPSPDVYFHEMTHVWQMKRKHSSIFGLRAIPMHIRDSYLQIVDHQVLYNYGGEAGLLQGKKNEKSFIQFGLEEQAMIVEDFYFLTVSTSTLDGVSLTSQYKELLEYYIEDMLSEPY